MKRGPLCLDTDVRGARFIAGVGKVSSNERGRRNSVGREHDEVNGNRVDEVLTNEARESVDESTAINSSAW